MDLVGFWRCPALIPLPRVRLKNIPVWVFHCADDATWTCVESSWILFSTQFQPVFVLHTCSIPKFWKVILNSAFWARWSFLWSAATNWWNVSGRWTPATWWTLPASHWNHNSRRWNQGDVVRYSRFDKDQEARWLVSCFLIHNVFICFFFNIFMGSAGDILTWHFFHQT